ALAHRALALVAEEDGIAQSRSQLQVEVRDRLLARARKGGALALLFEEAAEGVLVDEEALLLGDDPGQVHRESVGVVELEDDVTREDGRLAATRVDLRLNQRQAARKRPPESLLLAASHLDDQRFVLRKFRVGFRHLPDHL